MKHPIDENIKCENCLYYQEYHEETGICWRYPINIRSSEPVSSGFWCGEFKRRPGKKPLSDSDKEFFAKQKELQAKGYACHKCQFWREAPLFQDRNQCTEKPYVYTSKTECCDKFKEKEK